MMKFLYQPLARTLLLRGIRKDNLSLVQKAFGLATQHHLDLIDFDIGDKFPFMDYDGHDWATRKTTPLLLASHLGRKDIIEILLQKGAQVNDMDATRFNALEHALIEQHFECALILWRAGGDVFEQHSCDDLNKSVVLKKLQLDQGQWQHRLLEEESLNLQTHLSSTLDKPSESGAKKGLKKML